MDVKLKVKEKRYKEKAKNLNELVQGVKRKTIKKKLSPTSVKLNFLYKGRLFQTSERERISENQRTDLFLKLLKILLLHHQLMVWLFMLINLEVMEI